MAKRELAQRYIGTISGTLWAIVHPLVMITILWVVFGLGFRAAPTGGAPFVVFLTAGLSCWYLFSDVVSGSTGVVLEYRELIKKMPFPSQLLPLVKMLVGLLNHCIFVMLLVVLIAFHHMPLSLYYLQSLYYITALFLFSLGFSWLTAAMTPFLQDVQQVVNIILQVGMWFTPVLWDLNMLPESIRPYFIYNPIYYIVRGYRDSFIYFKPFWAYPIQTIVFWVITIMLLMFGAYSFKTLKHHFPEVL